MMVCAKWFHARLNLHFLPQEIAIAVVTEQPVSAIMTRTNPSRRASFEAKPWKVFRCSGQDPLG